MNKKITIMLAGISVLLMGCSLVTQKEAPTQNKQDTGFVIGSAGIYDSADTAVVVEKNTEEGTIMLKNLDIGRRYKLNYDSATYIEDKYKESMSMEQIMPGDIVEVTFYKERKRLNSIKISPAAWTYTEVSKFAIDDKGKTMTIAKEEYLLDKNAFIVSQGKPIELMELHESDILTVKGIDHKVLSLVVDRGHGYLRLQNDEYFIGGWIEVGQSMIQPVTEDMLLTVPEGTYQVLVSNKGSSGTKDVVIARNEEVELDIGDLKGEEVKIGNVLFAVTPSDAQVSMDGKPVTIAEAVPMEYGIHEMIVKKDGYRTIRQYLKVGEEYASVAVEMELIEEEEEETQESISSNQVSGNNATETTDNNTSNNKNNNTNNNTNNSTVSGNNSSNTTTGSTSSYKVKITAPEGAEVYVDGNYVGIAPIDFKKTEGSHTITLRKSGYQTRTYTVQIDSENKDISYAFSELTGL